MKPDPLKELLDQLCSGDEAAAEQAFRTYEPFLRLVVRRLLSTRMRAKFDSMDIVQSVWADVLHGFRDGGYHFESSAQLRAFLIKATRNRLIDRVRQQKGMLERELPLESVDPEEAATARDPRPSQVVQAEELWEQMLAVCPPAHHELLRLKREGLPLAEIAQRTGLHESSVRRILYDLARRLALKQKTLAACNDE